MTASYKDHLVKDTKLSIAVKDLEPFELVLREPIYLYLCKSIMSQQLSTKVASVIFKRFLDLYGDTHPTANEVANTPFDTLRAIGLSNAKTNYVLNVARFAVEHGMEAEKFMAMNNEEIIGYLTQIKGVGRWTVEMLLMFTLGREDVFAVDDLGIQYAMIGLYNLRQNDKKKLKKRMLTISQKWKPFRTYACLHLWHWQNTVGQQTGIKT
jgi:DNA-3-methyladenine glycosylase II